MTKPISILTFMSFENILSPDVISALQSNTIIWCRCCITSLWISIINFFISLSSIIFIDRFVHWLLKYKHLPYCFLILFCKSNEYTIFLPVIICCVELVFFRNSPNEPLYSLIKNEFQLSKYSHNYDIRL